MASYRIDINTGGIGDALEHAQYIQREGRYTEERYGELVDHGMANMPAWAREDVMAFWRASDKYERANGNTYREYELTLPRELSPAARVALVQRFAEQELGSTRPYQWAIHTCVASDGKEQPHAHLMFSDRQLDGIERGPERFFKRYNAKNPERGGCRKFSYGASKAEAALAYEGIRERWASVQNLALEAAGVEARVDHRSLAAQGIDREPGVHRGPAVSGIEARGQVSRVGARQREQLRERSQARGLVLEEVRVVTREEVAAERVAVRERRELASEVTGADRELVLPWVEADRREQLGRAQAAAERRIERRQGLGVGRALSEKLVTQARALRTRIVREVGRVKEWVREHFPDPLKKLQERLRGKQRGMGKGFGRAPATESSSLTAEHSQKGMAKPPTAEEIQAESRERWLKTREAAQGKNQPKTLEETRQQAREDWLELRELTAQGDPAARQRALVSMEFRRLARSRAANPEKAEDWDATPKQLRDAIERFNRESPEVQREILKAIVMRPETAKVIEEGMHARQQMLDRDGPTLEL